MGYLSLNVLCDIYNHWVQVSQKIHVLWTPEKLVRTPEFPRFLLPSACQSLTYHAHCKSECCTLQVLALAN